MTIELYDLLDFEGQQAEFNDLVSDNSVLFLNKTFIGISVADVVQILAEAGEQNIKHCKCNNTYLA